MHHRDRWLATGQVIAVRHANHAALVGDHQRPRCGFPFDTAARERVDDRSEIGAGVADEMMHTEHVEHFEKGLSGVLDCDRFTCTDRGLPGALLFDSVCAPATKAYA